MTTATFEAVRRKAVPFNFRAIDPVRPRFGNEDAWNRCGCCGRPDTTTSEGIELFDAEGNFLCDRCGGYDAPMLQYCRQLLRDEDVVALGRDGVAEFLHREGELTAEAAKRVAAEIFGDGGNKASDL
jgi:hypothetical protein